ncbi:MAG TPA: GNAT family N-acetyltransferase [Ktedonobacterales bacterium]|nr:GNAT family N-acetyltransferase [Ktedonobacterales bacterium]
MSEIVRDVSPESLARANEVHLAEGFAACVRAYGGETLDEPDLLWCAAGLRAAGWNRVTRANLTPETADVRIEWVKARARALGVPFRWDVGPSMRPEGLGDLLLRHGLTNEDDEPAMGVALAELPDAPSLPEGVTIERVSDPKTLEVWARVSSAGFEMPALLTDPLTAAMSRDDLSDSAERHYSLARQGGEPVATAGLALAAGIAGVFAVSTIATARGRGVGTAITLAPLLAARERGYAVGVLQASEMGYPVYRKIGFTEQFRYHGYIWRPA